MKKRGVQKDAPFTMLVVIVVVTGENFRKF